MQVVQKLKELTNYYKEIYWHKTTGIYEQSKEIYVNSGAVNINTSSKL